MDITSLKVPSWEKHAGLLHGFMGRRGGKSVGPYAGLNVSYRVGDDAKVVSQNVCDMKLAIGIHDGRVVTMKQVHGDDIVEVADTNIKEAGAADAMVTAQPNVFLGVLTADCVPILFVAPEGTTCRRGPCRVARHPCRYRREDRQIFRGQITTLLRDRWKPPWARPSAPAVMKSAMTLSSRSARAGESWRVPASNDPPPSPISTCGD